MTTYAIVVTQRKEGINDLEQVFHHNFSRGTLVTLEPSRMFDYTASSYNPVFGNPDLARRRNNQFNRFAQKVNESDVFVIPARFNRVAERVANFWLRARTLIGR